MANRMHRNNVVLFNVAEKAEGDEEGNQGQKCVDFVKNFIKDHLKLDEDIEIERAHRTPTRVNQAKTKDKPRLIHVAFLRYIEGALLRRRAPSTSRRCSMLLRI